MSWLEILVISVVVGVVGAYVQPRIAEAVRKKRRRRRAAARAQARRQTEHADRDAAVTVPRTHSSRVSVPSANAMHSTNTAHGVPVRRNPVPPRRGQTPMALGPRGVRPEKFPCCPLDRERNVAGKPQKIFWNGTENCYRCSHGHRFGANGRMI